MLILTVTAIAVEASTQNIWPQKYVNVTDPSTQDLIGLGTTYQLTLSTNVCIYGYIQVLPESSIGTLAAFGGSAEALRFGQSLSVLKNKLNPSNQPTFQN